MKACARFSGPCTGCWRETNVSTSVIHLCDLLLLLHGLNQQLAFQASCCCCWGHWWHWMGEPEMVRRGSRRSVDPPYERATAARNLPKTWTRTDVIERWPSSSFHTSKRKLQSRQPTQQLAYWAFSLWSSENEAFPRSATTLKTKMSNQAQIKHKLNATVQLLLT